LLQPLFFLSGESSSRDASCAAAFLIFWIFADFKISSDYLQKLSASSCPNCKFGDQHLLLKKGRDWELEAWYSHGKWHRDAGRTANFADGPD
jgi:hypothetical protein